MKTQPYWLATALALSLALSLLIPGVVAEDHAGRRVRSAHGHNVVPWKPKRRSSTITVMTQNVYVGADVDAILAVQDPREIPVVVALTFQQLLSTGFFERAATIAEQIARTRPHLIGLQEISLIRVQSPGDAAFGGTTPAEDVLFDYLAILLQALKAHHLHYRVVGKVKNADVELPMLVMPAPLVLSDVFTDVRLTDFDVVLARGDVKIFKKSIVEKNYDNSLEIPELGVSIPRGYVAVDARIKHRTYRFVNTHLEPADPDVRLAQAQELLEALADEKKPVIVVGDLNTPAPNGETYEEFVSEAEGFVDVWTHNLKKGEGEGFTFQHDLNLRNETDTLDQRIDLIFVRNLVRGQTRIGPVFAEVWGDELSERTPSGLWPSDHAGVIARMHIPVFHSW